jgi:hypothetical protein
MYEHEWPKLTACDPDRITPGDAIYGRGHFRADDGEDFTLFIRPLIVTSVNDLADRSYGFRGTDGRDGLPSYRVFYAGQFAIIEDTRSNPGRRMSASEYARVEKIFKETR